LHLEKNRGTERDAGRLPLDPPAGRNRGMHARRVVRAPHLALAAAHRTAAGAGERARPAKAPELGGVGLSLLASDRASPPGAKLVSLNSVRS
jgi:hypothetical protein